MKKYLLFLAFFSITLTSLAQDVTDWTAWTQMPCFKGLYYRVRRFGYSEGMRKWEWQVQFNNTYRKGMHFDEQLLTPEEENAYKRGVYKYNGFARQDLKPGEYTADEHTPGNYPIHTFLASNTNVWVHVFNVHYGDDGADIPPYALDDCGKPTGIDGEGTAGTQLPYGNDVVEPTAGPYEFWTEKDNVSIYTAWVSMSGNTLGVNLKVVNNNPFPVTVTWGGPKWLSYGVYIDPKLQPTVAPSQFGYSDKFNAGESKEAADHMMGTNGAEVYKFRPNWLNYTGPKGVWKPKQLSIEIYDFDILDANGHSLSAPPVQKQEEPPVVDNPKKQQNQPPQTNKAINFSHVESSSPNPNVQNAINQLNLAQTATDGITQTYYLGNADRLLQYEQLHGNTSQQVKNLRAQIARLQKQYNDQNNAALQQSMNNLFGGNDKPPEISDQGLKIKTDANDEAEKAKETQKREVKSSLSDFFNTVKFPKADSIKTDTAKKKKP